MCDCAETFHRKSCPRPGGGEPESRSSPDRPDRNKAVLLAFSALLCGLFGFMLYSLDRRTIKKILTMLGLGFLIAQPTATKSESHKPCIPRPNPCLKRPDPSEAKVVPDGPVPKTCKCRDKKPTTCDAPPPPPPPPSCLPLPPPPEKKCKCCPNS